MPRPWCHRYPPGVPPSYEYPDVPLTRFLDDAARDFPISDALRFQNRSWTWSEARDLVDRAAARLSDLGVGLGTRVGLISPTTPAAAVVSFAVWRLGGVLVPLDPTLSPDALADRLLTVSPTVVVTDVIALDSVAAVRHRLRDLRHVVVTDPMRWVGGATRLLAPALSRVLRRRTVTRDDDVLLLDELLGEGPALVRQVATHRDTPAAIIFTGGTTGAGRGVVLTHGNLVANAFQTRLWVPDVRTGHEVVLGVVPLWHTYGMTAVLLTGTLAAATIVLVPKPDAADVLDAIEKHRPTLFPGVPRLYQALAEAPGVARRDLTSLHVAVSGGAALEPATAAAFEAVAGGVRVRQGYGQSEMSPLALANPVYGPYDRNAVGLPVTDTVAIVRSLEDDDAIAPDGTPGELLVAGPQVMAGYWTGPDQPPTPPDGPWLATGDLASRDEDGVFTILGRRSDLVQRRDGPLLPYTVEDVLYRHPDVQSAALIGIDGDEPGHQTAIAVVVPKRRGHVTASDLNQRMRDRLLAHLEQELDPRDVPDAVVLRTSLPRNLLGKTLRRVLRRELAAERADVTDVREAS